MDKKQFVRVSETKILSLDSINDICMTRIAPFDMDDEPIFESDKKGKPWIITCAEYIIFRDCDTELISAVFEQVIESINYGIATNDTIIDLRSVLRHDGSFITEWEKERYGEGHPISDEDMKMVEKFRKEA